MFRFSHDSDSSKTSSNKTFPNNINTNFFTQNLQKSMPLHLSEVSVQNTQKMNKKGIATVLTHRRQASKDQSQEKISFGSRKSDEVYDQYVKTLQIQIASRQRQRVELYKNLQQVKRQNGIIHRDFNEERKKCAAFQMKAEQFEIFLKQNQEKRRGLSNEKEQLFKQFQFENQRRKTVEQNEQKLLYQFQAIQFQSASKSNQYAHNINRLHQQNSRFKQQIQKLQIQTKNYQLNNESLKKQLNDVFLQKTKIIDSILIEKQFTENQLHKQQSQLHQLRNIYQQKQQVLKTLNKKIIDLEKSKQSQKSNLTYQINQIKLQNQNIKKNYETAKDNFKRQLQALVNEGNRVREIINQLQKDKKVDISHITQLQRQLQILQRQKSSQIEQKISLADQLQKQKKSFEQQKLNLYFKIEHLQNNFQQKSRQLQNLNKKYIELQSQLEITKYRNSTQKELLTGEINFLKQQISAQSTEFSSESSKLIQERQKIQRYFNDQLSKFRLQSNQKLRSQQQTLQKQYQRKLQDFKQSYQTSIKILQNKIVGLKKQNQNQKMHVLQKQMALQQVLKQSAKKLTIQQTTSLELFRQMQEQLKKQLYQKNSLIKSLTQENRVLNEEISNLYTEIQKLKNQIKANKQRYEMQRNELLYRHQREETQLKNEIKFQKERRSQQKEQIKKQADKVNNQLQSEINQLQFQLKTSNQQKENLTISLNKLENSWSMSGSELRSQIFTLELQKNQFQELLSLKQQQFSENYERLTQQINQKVLIHANQTKQIKSRIDTIADAIFSVVQFAQKYSGENIKTNEIKLFNSSCEENLNYIYQTSMANCEQLTTFIGERLYAINVLMQQNTQLKTQIQTKNIQIINLQESLAQFTSQNTLLDQERTKILQELRELQTSLTQTNQENNDSISKLKEHVAFYKNQIHRYQLQFQQISSKIEEYQALSLKSQTRIIELEQQVSHLKDEIQKLINKHSTDLSSLIDKKRRELSLNQEEHQTQINYLNQQFLQKSQLLQNEIISHQERLKQFEKIMDKKNNQYQELQNHFNLIIERLNQQHLIRIQQYERELQFMSQKVNNSTNQELLLKRIQYLEDEFEKKNTELKVVEQNNALLRKNFINSIAEQQTLREEAKQNRSQHSGTKSRSKQKSLKDSSQDIKTKYLVRRNSQLKTGKQTGLDANQMNLSLSQRSYSNSQLSSRKFQTPRSSEKNTSNLNHSNVQKNQRGNQTQRPLSNFQRSTPNIPLDLKKIRERNQFYLHSQISNKSKNLSNQIKPQNSKSYSQSTLNLTTPIKMLEYNIPDILVEDDQIPQNQRS